MATTVKSGDTLWAIAQRVLGDGSRWRELLAPSGLPADFNPRLLQIGTVIKTAAEVKAPAPKPVAKPAPRPAPKPAPRPVARPPAPSPTSVPVQPGLKHEEFLLEIALQEMIAELEATLDRERQEIERSRQADLRRVQEAQLGANPADFVAFELFKRSMEEQGFETSSPARSDVDIQDLFSLALDLEGVDGASIGTGQFGVDLPASSAISRSQLQGFDATDIGLLSSFLRGGVETGEDTFQGINPEDFFTELEEGLVPVLPAQRTQFRF